MLQEMRLVKHLHAEPGLFKSPLTPAQIFRMATENGAKATGFGDEIGRLAVGKRADMVVLDFEAMAYPHLSPEYRSGVCADLSRQDAACAGHHDRGPRRLSRDGAFTFIDRDAALAALSENLARPQNESEAARAVLSRKLLPHLKEFYRDWPLPAGEHSWYRLNGRS